MRTSTRRAVLSAAVTALLAVGTGLVPSAAQATAPRPSHTAAGSPGTQVETVSVARRDGGTAQFGVFTDTTGADHLWYRTQTVPGGAYRSWQQVGTARLNNQYPVLSAAEDADGRLEAFTMEYQSTDIVRVAQTRPGGPWSAPAAFGPSSGASVPFYFGYPYLYRMADGRLAYFAVYSDATDNELFSAAQDAHGTWGSWTDLGTGPEPEPVGTPTSVTENPDGGLTVVAHLWNASSGYYCEITQLGAGGPWGPWRTCATDGCTDARRAGGPLR
ncbi:hypothetical protein ABZ832_11410 [Streptantibioticus parmotrematis]|uniref:hypothetical protein n=1 Tax=Streptantibioticus parmotrematis TaxID=2873249 RepID=UPI00340EBB12